MRYALQILLLALVSVYAWRRAGVTEKGGAALMAFLLFASPVYAAISTKAGQFDRIDLGYLVIDGVVLMAMIGFALVSEKWWPLWLAGAQLIAFLSHFVRLIDASYAPFAYALMMRAPSWVQLAILALGTWLAARRTPARQSAQSQSAGSASPGR